MKTFEKQIQEFLNVPKNELEASNRTSRLGYCAHIFLVPVTRGAAAF